MHASHQIKDQTIVFEDMSNAMAVRAWIDDNQEIGNDLEPIAHLSGRSPE